MPSEALKRRIIDLVSSQFYATIEQEGSQRYTQCLACNDTGLVEPGLVLQYLPRLYKFDSGFGDGMVRAIPVGQTGIQVGEIDGETIILNHDDPGFLGHPGFGCNRHGCNASLVVVETQGGSKQVERYARDTVTQLPPADCEYLHEMELERWRKTRPVKREVPTATVNNAIAQLTSEIKGIPSTPNPQASIPLDEVEF